MSAFDKVPRPGSHAALDLGCRCPILDNAHDLGYMGVAGQWCISELCPLHAKASREAQDEYEARAKASDVRCKQCDRYCVPLSDGRCGNCHSEDNYEREAGFTE